MLDLITDLTALMLQIKNLADNDHNAYELQILEGLSRTFSPQTDCNAHFSAGTVENIKMKLTPANQQVFQSCVEVHMQQIEVGLMNINLDKLVIGPINKN